MFRRWVLPILFLLAVGAAGAWLILARGETPAPTSPGVGLPPGARQVPGDPPAAPRPPDPPFGIVYGGELGGRFWIPPCSLAKQGGPHRVADVVRDLRASTGVAMLVDTGDLASAPGAAGALEYEAGLAFLSETGPSFLAVGEKDLLVGLDRWREAKSRAGPGVAVLCSNLRTAQGREVVAASAPLAVGGRKVLVTAVLSPSFEEGLRAAGVEVKLLPPAAAVREAAKAAGKVDFLVVISHAPYAESKSLLRELPEADVVFYAHAGAESEVTTEVVEGRALVAAGTGWQAVGGLSFVEPSAGARPAFLDSIVVPVSMKQAITNPVKVITDQFLDRARHPGVLEGSLREAASRERAARFVGARACATCHPGAHLALDAPGMPHARSMEPVKERGFLRVHQCLACHATAPGRAGGHVEPGDAQGAVTCEACHGPGAEHVAKEGKSRLADARASCAACHVREMNPDFRFEDAWPRVKHGK